MKKSGDFFLYVRKYSIVENKNKFYVYRVRTRDIFHTIGEMIYRSETHIDRIDFVEVTEEREKYWAEAGTPILAWHDKYWEEK